MLVTCTFVHALFLFTSTNGKLCVPSANYMRKYLLPEGDAPMGIPDSGNIRESHHAHPKAQIGNDTLCFCILPHMHCPDPLLPSPLTAYQM